MMHMKVLMHSHLLGNTNHGKRYTIAIKDRIGLTRHIMVVCEGTSKNFLIKFSTSERFGVLFPGKG